jgi:pimeloyl-ACP methyl ester carboxylesterase
MRVAVGDVRLFFDVDGCGVVADGARMTRRPTLVLLHGGPGADHSLFKPEFAAMTDVAQVVYLDQRGSGRSDRGDPIDWTWRQWADDVANLCTALGIDDPVLVGSSSGALVAMACAHRHPGLVAGLVLDSALGTPATLEDTLAVFERRGGPRAHEAARRYLGGDMSTAATDAWERYALPLYGGTNADGDLAVRRDRALINDDVQTHFRLGRCGPSDAEAYVGTISCPILILAGLDDPVSPATAAAALAGSVTNADVRLETFAGVGHGVLRQDPEEAFTVLRGFLHDLAYRTPGARGRRRVD